MAQVIGTNVLSLNAQRNLNSSGAKLATSLQRLSSGLRINSAKDDAAGLAISNRMTAQIKGLNQAARNANDGISLAQTAEGDLAAITNGLQRIRELAVQSANATNSASDRQALQAEVTQLVAEIDRISVASSFNGVSLLDGNFTSQQFQVGANANEIINVAQIASSRTTDIGQGTAASASGTAVAAVLGTGELTINGNSVAPAARDAAAVAAAINLADSTVTATATNTQAVAFTSANSATVQTATTLDTTTAGFTTATSNSAVATSGTNTTGGAAVSNAAVLSSTLVIPVASAETHVSTNNLPASFNFATDQVSFSVKVGGAGAETVTLNTNLVDESGFLAEINTQITEAATATVVGGKLVITADATGSASNLVIGSYNGDVDSGAATIADFVSGSITVDGRNNLDFSTQTADFTITVDGGGAQAGIHLDQLYASEAALLADLNSQVTGATITANAGALVFTSDTQGASSSIVISAFDGDLNGGGENFADFTAGVTQAGRDKYDFSGTNNVSFDVTIDGGAAQTVNLIADYDTTDATYLAGINGQLTGAVASLSGPGGNLIITSSSTGTGSTVAISGYDGDVDGLARSIADFTGGGAAVAGVNTVTDNNFILQLDGVDVLNTAGGIGTTVTQAQVNTAINNFVAGNSAYTVSSGTTFGTDLVISKTDGSDAALVVTSNFNSGGVLSGTVASTNGTTTAQATASGFDLSLDGVDLNFSAAVSDGAVTGAEAAGVINAVSGYTATYDGSNINVTKADGSNIALVETSAASGGLTAGATQTLYGSVSLASSADILIGGTNVANAGLSAGNNAAATSGVTVANTDISSTNGANLAIVTIDAALDTINSSRGNLGAIQSRFESVVSSLSTTAENLSAARSRIQDTDFAAETANLTKAQILQQAGISILSQANAQPQLVLSLLQ